MDACVNFACKRPRPNFADVGGEGGKKWLNFADVLYGWPLQACGFGIQNSVKNTLISQFTFFESELHLNLMAKAFMF